MCYIIVRSQPVISTTNLPINTLIGVLLQSRSTDFHIKCRTVNFQLQNLYIHGFMLRQKKQIKLSIAKIKQVYFARRTYALVSVGRNNSSFRNSATIVTTLHRNTLNSLEPDCCFIRLNSIVTRTPECNSSEAKLGLSKVLQHRESILF